MLDRVDRPQKNEYAEFHNGYIAATGDEADGLALLDRQQATIENMRRLTPLQAAHRYTADKWSVKEVIGHMADAERVLAYRLLRIARGDSTPLPGFDEKVIAAGSNANRRELADLVNELATVRVSTLTLVRSLDEASLARRGTVNEWSLTARGLVFITAGHFQHHVNVLRDRYRIDI
jgi:DinB superfamily